MYKRKTHSDEELRMACRRASLSRKSFKGGRPLGWRKNPNALPAKSVAVDALDYAILQKFCTDKKCTLKQAINTFTALIVCGGKVTNKHPDYAPDGWQYWQNAQTANTAN